MRAQWSVSAPVEIVRLVAGCKGVLLPGSPADVNQARYGHPKAPATANPDEARENVDALLITDAYNLIKPILSICYGLQSLNVWCGGTLVQDLSPVPVNHRAGRSVAVAHSVSLAMDSQLAAIAEEAQEGSATEEGWRLPVNSSHHQAVETVGNGLQVVGRCLEDGVIEAVAGTRSEHFFLGIQWHPERTFESSATSRLIFERFVAAARAWRPHVNVAETAI